MKAIASKVKARRALLASDAYTPNRLLAHVRERLDVPDNQCMCAYLGVDDGSVSRVAKRRHPITPGLIIAILDAIPEMTLARLRELAGMPRSEL